MAPQAQKLEPRGAKGARRIYRLLRRGFGAPAQTILDRAALQRRSCECYSVVKTAEDRLL
jgi:hypothetical protein